MNASSPPLAGRPPLTWAQSRLRLGITNVGFWVLASLLVVALRPAVPGGAFGWVTVVATVAAVQAPFDWVGGRWLPLRHGRPVATASAIARGVLLQSALWVLHGVALLAVAPLGWGAVAAVWAAALVLLVAGQVPLARLVGDLRSVPASPEVAQRLASAGIDPSTVEVIAASDHAFVGGWAGLPGRERLVVPARWLTDLPPDPAEVALLRRSLVRSSGARWRGMVAAAAWATAGFAVVLAAVPGAGVDTPGALLVTSAGGTLWTFVGLLTLPRLSRRAVTAVDRAAADRVGEARVARAVARLDEDQEDEPTRPDGIEGIFHPVPSPANRVRALGSRQDAAPGPWGVARASLYLGWAQFSVLSRAVHCNAGRPELWVLFPGD